MDRTLDAASDNNVGLDLRQNLAKRLKHAVIHVRCPPLRQVVHNPSFVVANQGLGVQQRPEYDPLDFCISLTCQ